MSNDIEGEETGGEELLPIAQSPQPTTVHQPSPGAGKRAHQVTDQSAPRMIDLRLLPAAVATWAATWWATAHPVARPAIVLCALAALSSAASYAWNRRHALPPRHALTPSRSARLAATLLLASTACALAVASAAGQSSLLDPARSDESPVHVRVRLLRDPTPASSGFSRRSRARVRILAVEVGQRWITSNATALVSAPGWRDGARGDVYQLEGSLDTSFAARPPSVGVIRARPERVRFRAVFAVRWRWLYRGGCTRHGCCLRCPAREAGIHRRLRREYARRRRGGGRG